MAHRMTPFLMFAGNAEQALNFYVALFPRSEIRHIQRYGAGEAGAEGSVMQAEFVVAGQPVMVIDSPVKHAFSFTPAISLFVTCEDEAELDRAFGQLAESGQVLMPLGNYGFSRKFGWVNDRFGVSWQLNLP